MIGIPAFYLSTFQKSKLNVREREGGEGGEGGIEVCITKITTVLIISISPVQKTFKEGLVIEVRKREKEQAKKKILIFIIVFYFW